MLAGIPFEPLFTYETANINIEKDTFSDVNPDSLRFIKAVYRLPIPVSFIIDNDSMKKYNKVQVFLLRHFSMKNVIDDTGKYMLKSDVLYIDGQRSQSMRWLHSFRLEIQHFASSLSHYLNLAFLEAEYEFEAKLANAKHFGIQNLYAIHRDYLDTLLKVTFLRNDIYSEEIKSCIEFFNLCVIELRDLVLSFEHLSEVGIDLLRDQQRQFSAILGEMKKSLRKMNSEKHTNDFLRMVLSINT